METTQITEKNRAHEQATAQLAGIREMTARMEEAEAAVESWDEADRGDADVLRQVAAYEEAREELLESPLSVEVRTDWHAPWAPGGSAPCEYKILLCWGGPAVQIIGTLDDHNYPDSARLQYQDWFTEWTDYPLRAAEEQTLIAYAREFSFEG
jgi:hypothetical protein